MNPSIEERDADYLALQDKHDFLAAERNALIAINKELRKELEEAQKQNAELRGKLQFHSSEWMRDG